LESFGDRIKALRTERGFSQRALAQSSGISAATLSRYENNMRVYHWETLANIADGLEVSTDYILCRTDIDEPVTESPAQARFVETFAQLCAGNQTLVRELAEALFESEFGAR
jgi:transcriptional regulator with XRE-family HTH domain